MSRRKLISACMVSPVLVAEVPVCSTADRSPHFADRRRARKCMKRVLITGMSGTGKSSVIQELAARGYRAYDLDTPEWSEWIDTDPSDSLTPARGKDWVWREERVRALLSQPGDGTLFIGGCAEK